MAKGTIGERVYRQLLRLYPRDFSDDYADEMTDLYRDRVRGEGASSVWVALVADLLRTAPREQAATLVQDVRYGWRTWRRTPILALAAILTLALGVGANTAVFSVVHGVLLRPLPYPDADHLVEVFEDNTRAGGGPFFRVSLLNYLSWVDRARSFDALAAFNGRDFIVTGHGDPERIAGSAVTASLFRVLGVAPLAGRPLSEEDEQPGAPPVAVLAESLWVRGFGRDPSVVGRSIALNGTPHRVVGVVPTAFREVGRTQIGSAGASQIFVPMTMDTAQSRANHTLRVVGRLAPGPRWTRAGTRCIASLSGWRRNFRPRIETGTYGSSGCAIRCSILAFACRSWCSLARLALCSSSPARTLRICCSRGRQPTTGARAPPGARRAARPTRATTAH